MFPYAVTFRKAEAPLAALAEEGFQRLLADLRANATRSAAKGQTLICMVCWRAIAIASAQPVEVGLMADQ
ncbi:hypothetical protein IQ273_17250 [Nodosilinea sp. LEGE 07298]|uniref:hypothetical protein n=1 Tax=Nodosilinea sp. LEGE 07298 TaxID=2777970 RepID=UPI00187DEB4F|nr:hypothetical protein [Nodosilinea sp. LEGE 07298]MBE9111154.1 hypothetical protein [Nodosilinea sp. LEGE 07298]